MRAEITGSGDELVIMLSMDELPVQASDASVRAKLPAPAGSIADGVLEMACDEDWCRILSVTVT